MPGGALGPGHRGALVEDRLEAAGSLILERGTVDVGDEFEVLHVFKQRKLKE